jgi:hypothetical protein
MFLSWPAGESMNQTDHTHACFGSGVGESNHFNAWNGSNDGFGQLVLQ